MDRKALLILTLILIISSFAVAQPPLPIAAGGLIAIDDIPIGGVTVQVVNLNTGESKTTTTSYDTPYTKCGYYTVPLSGQNGDVIKATVTYGDTYTNTVTVDVGQVTQWCNISIVTGEPPSPPPGGNGEPPEDPEDPPEEPEGNETEEPEQNDTDNDIYGLYNLSITVLDNTTGNPLVNASVTIYCNDSKVANSYTDDNGTSSFQLEEDDYVIELVKEGYIIGRGAVNLLCSMDHTFTMYEEVEDNPTPDTVEDQGTSLYVYAAISVAIVVIIVLGVFAYWWRYR